MIRHITSQTWSHCTQELENSWEGRKERPLQGSILLWTLPGRPSGLFSGWEVSSSEQQIHIPGVTGSCVFLRATDLTCLLAFLMNLSPFLSSCVQCPSPREKYQTSKYFLKSAKMILYPFPWDQLLEQAEGQTCHSWIHPPKHLCKPWHTTEALPALTDRESLMVLAKVKLLQFTVLKEWHRLLGSSVCPSSPQETVCSKTALTKLVLMFVYTKIKL